MTERPDAADPATGSVRYLDPEGLNKNPAFTNVVVVEGPARTVYVGGQDSVDASGNIVGKGDIAAQTEQVLANLQAALAAGGARPEHVIKWNLLLVEGVSLRTNRSRTVWAGASLSGLSRLRPLNVLSALIQRLFSGTRRSKGWPSTPRLG